jgi:hypothetical protein
MDEWVDGWVVCSCPVLSCPILSLPRPRRRALHAPGRLPRYILVCECVWVCGCLGGRADGVPAAACCRPFFHCPVYYRRMRPGWGVGGR